MAWLNQRSAALLAALAVPLCACDAEDDSAVRDDEELADQDIRDDADEEDPDQDDDAEASCSEQGASRECDFGGDDGVQYCDDIDGELVWGECVGPAACTPGDSESCGLGEEFGNPTDSCQLEDGVPMWGCEANDDFESCPCNTPLVLQFDGAAVQMVASPAATFDIDGVGACVSTDWPTSDTPWLALDLDKDGTIDSGRELFGSGTRIGGNRRARNGFMALSALDTDRNGRIDAHDERFADLVLWSDHDGDKRGTFAEMQPLSVRSVLSIELDYVVRPECDDRGNCGIERSAFTYVDATGTIAKGEVVDVHLACQ
ncbi:MAG: calcium-binding protein [Nannocystaceae bacterium]|nr:calcium-binding protein [bacterium]